MDFFTEAIKELRAMQCSYNKGNLNEEKLRVNLDISSEVEKFARDRVALFAVLGRYPQLKPDIEGTVLLGAGTKKHFITNYENEKIACNIQSKNITRAECLDYSGSHDGCIGCPEKKKTNDLLLKNNDMTA